MQPEVLTGQRLQQEDAVAVLDAAPTPSGETDPQVLLHAWELLVEATATLNTRLAEALRVQGISQIELAVLTRLARENGQRMPMTRLAEAVSLTSGGFTKLADSMERTGLIYRQPSSKDRRVIFAVLTDAGRECHQQSMPHQVATLRQNLEQVIGGAGIEQLSLLARAVRDADVLELPSTRWR